MGWLSKLFGKREAPSSTGAPTTFSAPPARTTTPPIAPPSVTVPRPAIVLSATPAPPFGSTDPWKAGDVLLFDLAPGEFATLRILGSARSMDHSKLTPYAIKELTQPDGREIRRLYQSGVCVFPTAWYGTEKPNPSDPKLRRPLYVVKTGFIDDYYDSMVRWVEWSEVSALSHITSIPITNELSYGILRPGLRLEGLRTAVLKQVRAQQAANPDFIRTASEAQLQAHGKFQLEDGQSLGAELDALIGELMFLGNKTEFRDSDRNPHPRARSIGEELFAMGGRNFMMAAWWRIHGAQPRFSMQSLNFCWHGIGDWTA